MTFWLYLEALFGGFGADFQHLSKFLKEKDVMRKNFSEVGFSYTFSFAFSLQTVPPPLETKSAAQGLGSGDFVKHHILGKALIL